MANICDLHMARHCLAAAVCLIEKEAKRVSSERENISTSTSAEAEKVRDDLEERWEKTSRCRADVYRLFLKYGLTLLQCSKDRLLNVVDVDDILLQTESNPIDHSGSHVKNIKKFIHNWTLVNEFSNLFAIISIFTSKLRQFVLIYRH